MYVAPPVAWQSTPVAEYAIWQVLVAQAAMKPLAVKLVGELTAAAIIALAQFAAQAPQPV